MRDHPSPASGRALLAAVVALAVSLCLGCTSRPIGSASIANGTIDLSNGIDFEGGNLIRLDGNWEFYRGRLLKPEDFARGELGPSELLRVPGYWAQAVGFPGPKRGLAGVGTLRLRVRVPAGQDEWALRLSDACSSTRVYVNGAEVAAIGRVGERADLCTPAKGVAIPRFRAPDGGIEIVMQVANFSMPESGTWDSPLLGKASPLLAKRQWDLVSTSFISGALLIMGLYHLGLFLLRKKDLASLYFALICFLMTVRNLMMGEKLLQSLMPITAGWWEWSFRVELLSAHLALPLFALFFQRLFPRHVAKLPVKIIVAVGCAWAILVLATSAMIFDRFRHWYEYFLLAAGLYIIGAVVFAWIRKERGAPIVIVGLFCLFATSTNDVLLSTGILTRTFYMASYGVFLYIFAQSFHLSMIFSKSFSDVEELSTSLKAKNRELESLHTIDLAIASREELAAVLEVILEQAIARLGVDAADVLLLDAEGVELSLGARSGFRTEALLHTRLRAGEGFAGRALQSDEAVIVQDLDERSEGFSRSPAFTNEGFFFYAGRRLTLKGRKVGVLELYRRSPFRPYSSWELYFETLAGQAAVALDNSSLLSGLKLANEELRQANEATIEGWAVALELRDRETEGHSRRVTGMTMSLAQSFGISGEELESVRHGALLHDIGKMGIPDSILLKPGPLTDEEFAIMKRHPTIARDLLSGLHFLDRALDIPYSHHEKWDGSGYPLGLAGIAIPLPARLFAVVDVWDALRSDRPYRAGWPEEKVLAHIDSQSGSHFDPKAAEAFIELRRRIDRGS
jgi:Response regulator containing a CheY-like receiver domain and an HD-GYP domain